MSEIFYSEVDKALKAELNARGLAGRLDRSNESLNFMLGKIANVELIAYDDNNKTKELTRLGGITVRQGEYLPSGPDQYPGFLNDRKTSVQISSWKQSAEGALEVDTAAPVISTNSTKRIPPYITSADVNIGDHSMGLLNKSTINIKIPNPEQDFNYFEAVWLRPGRAVDVIIEHPESAVITQGELSGSLPSAEKIKKLNPNANIKNLKKLNRYEFSGLITNFTFSYQSDTSVDVTINLTGTSNVYTDVSLLMNNQTLQRDQIDIIVGEEDPEQSAAEAAAEPKTVNQEVLDIYTDLDAEVEDFINGVPDAVRRNPYIGIYPATVNTQDLDDWWFSGKIYPGSPYGDARYITLGYLISYLNRVIIQKRKQANPDSTDLENLIIFTKDQNLCVSNYYKHIVSANPFEIILINPTDKSTQTYGSLEIYKNQNYTDTFGNVFPDYQKNFTAYPSTILINLTVIEAIVNKYKYVKTKFNVNQFLQDISAIVKRNTGGAINLALISHPDITNALIWYDRNSVSITDVEPYTVPMFANSAFGTIVHDFKFSAKIPDSAKSLSYVLNQNPEEISEENVAPFLNFMYNSANVIRKNNGERTAGGVLQETEGVVEVDGETKPIAEILIEKGNATWKEKHEKYLEELNKAKVAMGNNPSSEDTQLQLRQALVKYVQYPTDSISRSNAIAAPMYPFDAELTIDGINGFRYGDVLEFPGLPERFRSNTTFSIINVTHTVSNDGQWTTNLKCIMRPRFT